jgi:hypothetical protein
MASISRLDLLYRYLPRPSVAPEHNEKQALN